MNQWMQLIGNILDLERMRESYEVNVRRLLRWIEQKIGELDDRSFLVLQSGTAAQLPSPTPLDRINQEFGKFTNYRTLEKPPKYYTQVFSIDPIFTTRT